MPVRLLSVSVAAAAAGWTFGPVFSGSRLPLVVTVSAVLPVLVAAALRRRPLWMASVGSAAAWVLAAGAVVPWPGRFPPWDVVRATPAGVGLLLDQVPSAPAASGALVLPSMLTWIAAATAAELVLRGESGVLPVLPAWCAWATGVALTVPDSGTHLATATVLLGTTLATARPTLRSGVVSVVAGVVATAVLAGAGIAGAVVSSRGPDPIEIRPSSKKVMDDALARYDGWRARPATRLFDTDGAAAAYRWRLAELDELTDDRWVTAAKFRPVIPSGTGSRRSVTVTGLDGAFLPAGGPLAAARGTDAALWTDPPTGMLVRSSRDFPLSYDVADAARADRPAPADTVVPPACRAPAEKVAGAVGRQVGPAASGTDAIAVAARLAAYLTPSVPTGRTERPYGCAALAGVVRDRRATEVQRIVAYVLAVRTRGIPARVVVGFAAGSGGGERRTVTGADARVWSEVYLAESWLAITIPATPGRATTASATGPTLSAGENPNRPVGSGERPLHLPRSELLALVTLLALLAAAAAVTRLVLVAQRRHRAARARRTGPPGLRLRAAWQDAVARLVHSGAEIPAPATIGEIVSVGRSRLDPAAAAALGLLADDADRFLYRDEEPDEAAAAAAWDRRDEIVRALRGARTTPAGRHRPADETPTGDED